MQLSKRNRENAIHKLVILGVCLACNWDEQTAAIVKRAKVTRSHSKNLCSSRILNQLSGCSITEKKTQQNVFLKLYMMIKSQKLMSNLGYL